jgi:hypothetical protein
VGAQSLVHGLHVLAQRGRLTGAEPARGGGRMLPVLPQPGLPDVDLEREPLGRQAVPEAGVDLALAGPQRRERLAPRVADLAQLAVHHPGQQPAPAVGRRDRDHRHVCGRQHRARHRQFAGEDAGVADRLVVVHRDQRAVGLEDAPLDLV